MADASETKDTSGDQEMKPEVSSPKELEEDSPVDKRKRLAQPPKFLTSDMTLNVLPSTVGGMLVPLTDGGMHNFFGAARANTGLRAGRYMFEVKIVQHMIETGAYQKGELRVGLSTAGTDPILGDNEESIAFDSAGALLYNNKRTPLTNSFSNANTVAIVLNLSKEGTANASTIALFKDGQRVTPPQPLPDALKGKALFPTVAFKGMTVHVNLGPVADVPLPFKCRMVQDASVEDAVVTQCAAPKDGKHEIVFPVMIPEEGTFDWLDWFLAKNPEYSAISDQKIIGWASKSGLQNYANQGLPSSNDKPPMNFGIAPVDDGSLKKVLMTGACVQPRSVIAMEVKGNLTKADRVAALQRCRTPYVKKVARVMVGLPTGAYKDFVLKRILKLKQEKCDIAFRAKKTQSKIDKLAELKQRQVDWAKRKAEREQRNKDREAKRKDREAKMAEAEMAKKMQEAAKEAAKKILGQEAATKGEEVKETKEETKDKDADKAASEEAPDAMAAMQAMADKQLTKEAAAGDEATSAEDKGDKMAVDEEKVEDAKEVEAMPEVSDDEMDEEEEPKAVVEENEDEEPPQVELTPKEQADDLFASALGQISDLALPVMNSSYTKFSLPEDDEGFDAIEYAWNDRKASVEYMNRWMLNKKMATRIDNIEPSAWFQEKWTTFKENLQNWHAKSMEFQDPIKRAALLAAKKGESKEPEPTQKASKDDDPMKDLEEELDREDFDVFSVDDIFDTGTGEPLFANFAFEDWALLSLRFEMHILIHAFKRDCGETDRTGIPPDHLTFYYYRYFKKGLNVQSYGCQNVADVLQLVRDTVLPCMKILEPQIDGELETNEVFLKLTEESRRERQKRIEVGEEGAVLKLTCTPYDIGLFNVGVGRPLPVRPSMMGVPGGMQMPGGMPGGMQMPGPPGMPVRAQMPGWNAGPPMRAQMPPGGAQNFGGPAWRPPNQNFGGPPNQNQMPRNNPGGCGGWPNAPCGGGGGGPGGGGGWPNAAPGGGGGWPNAGAPAQTKGGWENTNSAPAAKDGGWPAANGFPPAPGGWPAANGFPPAPAKAQAQGGWQDPAANFGAFGAPAQAKSGPSAWPAANNQGGWAAPANNAQGGWAAPGGNAQAPANNAQSGWAAPGGNAQAGNSGWQQSSGGQGGWNASSSNAQGGWTAPASNVQAGAAQGGWNASASTAQGGGWNAAGGNSQGGWNASGSGAEAGGWQSKDGGQQANVGGWQNPNSAPQAKAAWPATGNPAAVAGGWQQQQQQRTPPGGGGGDWN